MAEAHWGGLPDDIKAEVDLVLPSLMREVISALEATIDRTGA